LKNQFLASTIIACSLVALAVPIAAPADPITGSVATKRITTPVAPRANQPTQQFTQPIAKTGAAGAGTRLLPTNAPSEACVYDDAYWNGATNADTTFCTNKLGFQELPPERQARISAADIPEGYTLVLYERPDKTGKTCRLAGNNTGVIASCDNMARAISLEIATPARLAQVQSDKERGAREAAANDPGFAPKIEEDRAAAARRQEEIAAEERAARSRMAQEDRRDAAARDAAATRERQRVAAEEVARATYKSEIDAIVAEVANMYAGMPCLLETSENSQNSLARLFRDAPLACFNYSVAYVGDGRNDDIERVYIRHPRVQVTFYEHRNFGGRSVRLTCGFYEFEDEPENEVSSIKIEILPSPAVCAFGNSPNIQFWDDGAR
jgi:hypothetical protein